MKVKITLLLFALLSLQGFSQIDYSTIPNDTNALWIAETGYWAAQDRKTLTSQQNSEISSMKVAATGSVVLFSKNQRITVYDGDNGKTVVDSREKEADIPAVFSSSYEEVPGSPYFTVNSARKTFFINSLTGETSKEKTEKEEEESAIKKVTEQYVLPRAGAVLYTGRTGWKAGMELKNLQTDEGWVQDNIFTWKMQEMVITGAPFEISAEEFVLPLDKAIYCVNSKTGELKWRTYISIPITTGYDGPTSKNNTEKEGMSDTPEPGPSLLFKHADKPYIYLINDLGLTAYDLETGKEVWKRYRKADHDSRPIFTPKGLIVMKDKVELLDYDTGDQLLNKTAKVDGKVSFHAFVGSGIVIGFTLENKRGQKYTELNLLDPNTGLFKFEENFKTYGNLMQIMPCDKGVFYTTDRCVGIWDQSTGTDAFEPVSVSTERQTFVDGRKYNADYVSQINGQLITTFKGSSSYIYNTETDELYEIDTKTGTKKTFGEKVPAFKPDFIEARKSGIFISSPNKMVLFGYDGKLIYNQHFPPPGETTFGKFMSFAGAAYANYYMMNEPYRKPQGPELTLQDIKSMEGSAFDKTKALFANNLQVQVHVPKTDSKIKQRYELSKKEVAYTYIVTSMKKGADAETEYGLAKIHRDTGKVEKVFPFGQNRSPQFVIDEATQKLFYVERKNLYAYSL